MDPDFICHHLNVNPLTIPKKQLPRRPSKEHAEAVHQEVKKLKQAGAIKEVFYPEWLANTVVVKKKSGKWRVYVDFTDLNKACPKDPFPMPQDRLAGGCHCRPSSDEFLGRFSGLSSDTFGLGRSRKNCLCYSSRELPLQGDAIWLEECMFHLSENDDEDVRTNIGKKH